MGKYRDDGADAIFTVVRVNSGGYDPDNPTRGEPRHPVQ